jgi:thioredoxin-like negative regulator of GroEL
MKNIHFVFLFTFISLSHSGIAGTLGIHDSSGKAPTEVGHAKEGKTVEQNGEPVEIPSDITSLDALRRWLQRFPEEEAVIKMGATWCGPCRDLHPEIEKLAKKKAGELKVLTIDIDNNPTLARLLSPRGMVPAIVTIKNDGKSAASQPLIGFKVNQPSPIGNWLKTK